MRNLNLANTTYTRLTFAPKNNIIDQVFYDNIEIFKHLFKKLSGCYELVLEQHPDFTYHVGQRYNHHSTNMFFECIKDIPDLLVDMATYIEPLDDGMFHHLSAEDGLVQYFPPHIQVEIDLGKHEESNLEDLTENWE